MAPSIAAAYCALIVRHLSEGGEVITSGVTALAGPAALVWLHGSIRRMNPGGYVLFTRGHTRESVEAEHSHAHGSRFFDGSDSGPEALCYERLLRRAGTHVDLGEVLDQPLFEPRLRELLLVGPVACPERARTRSPSSNLRAPDHGIWGEPEPPASHLSQ